MNVQINIWVVIGILVIHWFADFVCQTDKDAKNKSKNFNALLHHTIAYSLIWVLPTSIYSISTDNWWMIVFVPITFVFHTFTDYYTSRVNAQLYSEGKTHEFFVSIGFDQLLHFAQLIITFQILK